MSISTFDLTDVTDVLVPVYSFFVLLFVIAYHKSPETKLEDRYFLKKVVKVEQKRDWREVITGYFHQTESCGFDEWLKFLCKPYPIRLLAPTLFHKKHMDIKLTATQLTLRRYWNPNKEKGEAEIVIALGTSREEAKETKYVADTKEDCGLWKAWIAEGDDRLHCVFTPDDPNSNPVLYLTREVIDNDTLLVNWHGDFKGKTCTMESTYRRVG